MKAKAFGEALWARFTSRSNLGPWIARCVVTAGVMSMLELVYVLGIMPVAASDAVGFVLFCAQLLGIHLTTALVLALLCARLDTRLKKIPWPDPAALTSICVGMGLAVYAISAVQSFTIKGQHRQFPVRLELLEVLGTAVVIVVCLGVAWFVLRPLLVLLYARLPNLSKPRVVPVMICCIAALFVIWTADFGLYPLHLDALTGPAGVFSCALVLLATRWLWRAPSILATRLSLGVLAALLLVVPLGSNRNPHARFVLYAHTPLAGSLARHFRNLVDFDGDGASSVWLGGQDCDELNAAVGPAMREIPGDGVDQDCRGGDAPWAAVESEFQGSIPTACALPEDRLSFVLITVDAWFADQLNQRIAPIAMEFKKRATLFTRAYAPATMTDKVLVSLLTGDPLSDVSAANMIADETHCIGVPFVERLRRAGYRTAVINPLGTAEAARQGFEQRNPRGTVRDPLTVNIASAFLSAGTTNDGLAYVVRHRNDPFFLWLHYLDPHAPYRDPYQFEPSQDGFTAHERRVSYADAQIGRLIDGIAKQGLLSKTVIAITADHGEAVGRRGREGHGPDAYEEIIGVPLIIWVPGCPTRVVDKPVSTAQIGPTFSALAGLPPGGENLLTAPDRADRPVISEAFFKGNLFAMPSLRRAVVTERYKLIVDVRDGGKLLFDLSADPGEEIDLYRARPGAAAQTEALYQRWLDRPRPPHLENCRPVSTTAGGRTIDFSSHDK